MERIISYQDFEARVAACKARAGRLTNNNYHLEPELAGLIGQGRVFALEGSDTLTFLLDNGNYQDLLFYLPAAPEAAFPLEMLQKPTLISVVFNRQTQKLLDAEAYWQAQGFTLYKASRHMTIDVDVMDPPRHDIRPAQTRAQAEEFAGMIAASFYSYGDGVPDADTVWQDIQDGRVMACWAQPENVIAGYMRTAAPEGNHTDNLGISIKPGFKGRGYSRSIIQAFGPWCRSRGVRYMTLWVNRGNTVAERLYETLGYQYSGKESRQYLYEPSK